MTKYFVWIAILALGLAALGCSPAATPRPTGYAHPEVLAETDWVAAHLSDAQVRLIDVSSKKDIYERGHLPSSVYVSVSELTNPQAVTPTPLEIRLGQLGIKRDTTLVLYDDMQSLYAARAFVLLKQAGHADVKILNGGSVRWVQEKREMTKDVPTFSPSMYSTVPATSRDRVNVDYVLSHLQKPGVVLVDARNAAEFGGQQANAARGGHIPGAVNIEWNSAMMPDGTFRSIAELQRLFQRVGITPDSEIITYCQSGTRGAHEWFVLKYLVGMPNVSLYEGSWAEWGNRSDLPIETSAGRPTPELTPTKEPDPCK